MEIEYQLSKKDYFRAGQLYQKDLLQRRSWVFILLVIILIYAFSGDSFIWWRFLIAIIVSPAVVIVALYFIPIFISFIRLNKIFKKDGSGLERKRLAVTDEGLLIESSAKSHVLRWESIVSSQSNDKFIYLTLADKKITPFPKSAFGSETDAINFLGLIQSNVIRVRGMSLFPNSKISSKPGYAIGLLCLIPLIGAFAGVVFIVNGIFKYKDKWFVIIGAAGIIWTVALYSSLFYSTTTIGFKKLLAEQSQKQLNSAMKAVEFYKLKNGAYPDSLEQVNDDNSETWLYDPLQPGGKINKSNEFNYRKAGNHYYLFSSGVDGIPNTKDDIYPQVAASDSAKFGWKRK